MRKAQGSSCRPASALSLSPATLETHALCTVICPAVGVAEETRRAPSFQGLGPQEKRRDRSRLLEPPAPSPFCWDGPSSCRPGVLAPERRRPRGTSVSPGCAPRRLPGRSPTPRAALAKDISTYLRSNAGESARPARSMFYVHSRVYLVQHSNVMYLIVEAEKAPKRGKGPSTIHLELGLHRKAHPYHP